MTIGRSFPGADTGNNYDLVMMSLRVRMKKTKIRTLSRLRFELEKLRNPDVASTVKATIGGKFAPLINLRDDDIDIDSMINIYNTVVTAKASEILGKECRRKKPWLTRNFPTRCLG